MAEYKNGGLDRKTLAEKKSKRLEEALSAYTSEQTKETVSKLLEAYTDDGKNYFGAGTRDTTLYFADDEYIREIEKEKTAAAQATEAENSDEPDKEKNSFVGKLHKLTSFITAGEDESGEETEQKEPERHHIDSREIPISELGVRNEDKAEAENKEPEEAEPKEEKPGTTAQVYEEAAAEIEEQTAQALESLVKAENENIPQSEAEVQNDIPAEDTKEEPEKAEPARESESAQAEKQGAAAQEAESTSEEAEYEPTIVIKPIKPDNTEKAEKTEEDTKDMRREFFDNEIEVDEVPRRRRKHTEPAPEVREVKEPESEYEEAEEDFEDDYDDDEYEDDVEEKKSKFGGFFGRKKKDDFYDDEYDDDDEFDDEYYDDDEYEEEGIFTIGRVLNILVIVALICSTAFFAASNYTNSKKLESANTQINELNNGNAAGGTDEQINQLKAQIDTLTAENERLKSGGTQQTGTTPSSTGIVSSPTSTTPASTTISGTAPADDTDSSSTSSASGSTYTIKAGDTGSKICNAVYGQYTPELWDKILSANGMTTSTVYHPGDVLQIP